MALIYILLIVIAVGVLLMSKEGKGALRGIGKLILALTTVGAAVLLIVSFKPDEMDRCMSFLLLVALERGTVRADELPGELVGDSKHRSGAACGALVSLGLLRVKERIPSPDPKAKGRRLNVYVVPHGRRRTVMAFLKAKKVSHRVAEDMPLFENRAT